MPNLLIILFALSFISCSKVRSLDEATKPKSDIKSLFKAKTINEKFNGDSVRMKIILPLSQNTLGHYDVEDILAPSCYKEDKNYQKCLIKLRKYEESQMISDKEKSAWQRFKKGMKFNIYNLAIKLGYSSKLKYSFSYELPELPLEYFKQVRVKKLFFALEECDKDDIVCQQRQETKPLTFDFMEKFFLNVSVLQSHDPLDFEDKPFTTPSKKQFKRFANQAFGERLVSFHDATDSEGKVREEAYYDLNIARMDNTIKKKRNNKANIRDNGKTFIYTIDKDYIHEAKDFFESSKFSGIVSDVTLIGKNLYVELYGTQLKDKFFSIVNEYPNYVEDLGIEDFKGCTEASCASLNVNSINLVPMIEKSYEFKFDTFFAIKHLDYNDFKYNGYLELEIELDLPM